MNVDLRNVEKVEVEFLSTDERDQWLADEFPQRETTQTPGLYETPDGTMVGVRFETVTIYNA